jgi:glycosidase
MEFHVSRQARDRYQFADALFSLSGNVIFANFQASRTFAQTINQKRDLMNFPEQAVQPGELNAMGLIDEIFHHIVKLYREQENPQVMEKALAWLEEQVGKREVDRALVVFASEFPPLAVYQGLMTLSEYFEQTTEGMPNRQAVLEEMLMLWLANKNPACASFQELFDDSRLSEETVYPHIMAELYRFFDTQPTFGPQSQNLVDMLRTPAIEVPYSLFGQLEYIRDRWEVMVGTFLTRLLSSIDLIREEQMQRGFMGPGPVEVPVYDELASEFGADAETENFSLDQEWMPRLVLMAKNTYVWLHQLSQAYNREITRLDQIPDEELERMARAGFTGLWLIGLWERSQASARIKQLMGNPEAIASAYSLYDYRIAEDLGGEEAYRGLRDKAWRFGIRLASDMVPNHMGIDSNWVADHPDWFISLDYSPFPSYTYNGPDLSSDERVSIMLEDHYFTRTDAAVTFKLYDHRSSRDYYIYHGNDGTTMPWNDTAQLNYLLPEVREAVIQTILAVARRFPIIRFDAAMTLAKLHYQRLWFPVPGTGGAIPSRAEFGMTKEEFDRQIPVEFWREVVDRAAQEAPDTLLLAEAFWMMESYFVRTLGMHRVYNSAFMNLLRNEENAKYRLIMKNTLEFDPEILKRYVNFMNNPDERTAVDQFGKGDKYFGVATLLATMPGLPMFGHGQVEGYSEKYGMEFKRPYWDEHPDPDLVERHRREIFPLLHRRALFAGVDNFLLYDFFSEDGSVNEDVFAYSNGVENERALVIYHNRFGSTQGWVRTSTGFSVKGPDGERYIIQRSLGEGLNLHADPRAYCLFRDTVSGLEYIRPSQDIISQGLFFSLNAYECHAFVDFREVMDDDWGSYRRVNEYLSGRGVSNVKSSLQDLLLQPVLQPVREVLHPAYFRYLLGARLVEPDQALAADLLIEAETKLVRLLQGIEQFTGSREGRERLTRELRTGMRLALSLPTLEQRYPLPGSKKYAQAVAYLKQVPGDAEDEYWILLFGWLFLHNLGLASGTDEVENVTASWINEWQFSRVLSETARDLGVSENRARDLSSLLRVLVEQQRWFSEMGQKTPGEMMQSWLANNDIQRYLDVNRFEEALWFNKERFESFVWWMVLLSVFETISISKARASLLVERLLISYQVAQKLLLAAEKSGYQVSRLLKNLQ